MVVIVQSKPDPRGGVVQFLYGPRDGEQLFLHIDYLKRGVIHIAQSDESGRITSYSVYRKSRRTAGGIPLWKFKCTIVKQVK